MDGLCCASCSGGRSGGRMRTYKWTLDMLLVLTLLLAAMQQTQAQVDESQIDEGSLCDIPIQDKFIENIPENWPVGTVIRHLQIYGSSSQVAITEKVPNSYVSFDPDSRNLTLIQALDAEMGTIINVKLECLIKSTTQDIEIDIKILLLDVNDNAPEFVRDRYEVSVSEMTPINTPIVQGISASDKDQDNYYVTYSIVEGPFSDYFSIPIPARGEIMLTKRLDYENHKSMDLTLMVQDYHPAVKGVEQPVLNSTTLVAITVYDGDDQNPYFLHDVYTATLLENTPQGSLVDVQPPIQALDGDTGLDAAINYTIVPDPGSSDYFVLDPVDASLHLVKDTIHRGTLFSLLLKATQVDNEDKYGTALLRIQVIAANQNEPKFDNPHYMVSILENSPEGTAVITVLATDNDEGDPSTSLVPAGATAPDYNQGTQLVYSFSPGQSISDFQIDQMGGLITSARMLDYESTPQYNITVQASDGENIAETLVTINIININDNNPHFTQDSYIFNGKREANLFLGQVIATDGDPGSVLTYRFKEQEENKLFSINNLGEIYVIASDPENEIAESTYTLLAVSADEGSPPRQDGTLVHINFGKTGAVMSEEESGELNLILIIILGAISGILLVVIIVILVYIYRNHNKNQGPRQDFVRSQSFERQLNLESPAVRKAGPAYMNDPQGTGYKSNQAHHLALYHDINLDEEGTRPQVNPFIPDDSYTGYNRRIDINDNRYSNSIPSGSPTADNVRHAMKGVNEIEYDTALAPMDQVLEDSDDASLASSGPPSVAGSLSTFKASSTQKLVTPGVTPKGTMKKQSGVSFIEDGGGYASPQPVGLDPNVSVVGSEDDRPGITVYY